MSSPGGQFSRRTALLHILILNVCARNQKYIYQVPLHNTSIYFLKSVLSQHQIFRTHPAASSKQGSGQGSQLKLGIIILIEVFLTNQIAQASKLGL